MYVHCQQRTDTCDIACLIPQSVQHINLDWYSTPKCLKKHTEAAENVILSCLTCIPSLHLKNCHFFHQLACAICTLKAFHYSHYVFTLQSHLSHARVAAYSSISQSMPTHSVSHISSVWSFKLYLFGNWICFDNLWQDLFKLSLSCTHHDLRWSLFFLVRRNRHFKGMSLQTFLSGGNLGYNELCSKLA